ncbi:Protein of unknown function [Cotesia congregata]|uniref:BEN domain-containing protein n=1 Tax=Cotesia congregata TaxID=51543 RepID=A0A8J2E9S9_COTCN|nr:Protein of unknown function [Cotesia congregata]
MAVDAQAAVDFGKLTCRVRVSRRTSDEIDCELTTCSGANMWDYIKTYSFVLINIFLIIIISKLGVGIVDLRSTTVFTVTVVYAQSLAVCLKELGLPEFGVFIPEAQFNVAKRAQSATAMATSLLIVIANSNLRGEKSKTKNSTIQHSGLDSDKLTAIHDAVEKLFKRRYNKSEVNRAINVKCSRVRSEEKEAKAQKGAKKPKLDGEFDVKP